MVVVGDEERSILRLRSLLPAHRAAQWDAMAAPISDWDGVVFAPRSIAESAEPANRLVSLSLNDFGLSLSTEDLMSCLRTFTALEHLDLKDNPNLTGMRPRHQSLCVRASALHGVKRNLFVVRCDAVD